MRTGAVLLLICSAACGRDFSVPEAPEDRTPPGFLDVAASPAYARSGTVVRLSFVVTKALEEGTAASPNPQASFAGVEMDCSGEDLVYLCEVVVDGSMPEGEAGFTLQARDAAGRESPVVEPRPTVILDFTPPTLVATAVPRRAAKGDAVTFTITADEPLGEAPIIDGVFLADSPHCLGVVPGDSFTCIGGLVSDDVDDPVGAYVAIGHDLAGNEGMAPGSIEIRERAPVIFIEPISPNPARAGDVLDITFSAQIDLTGCRAEVAGIPAECAAPDGPVCTCSHLVPPDLPDGGVTVDAEGMNGPEIGIARAIVQIDNTPPVVSGARIVIERRAVGEDDAVRGESGAVVDGWPVYPGQTVVAVRIFDAPDATEPVAVAVPNGDGSFPGVALPGTGGTDESNRAPSRLWASAIDGVGNESGRVEILEGRDIDPPEVDGTRITVHVQPGGADGSVSGQPGAVVDAVSAIAGVRFFDAPEGGRLLATLQPDADGALPEVAITEFSGDRVFVEAVDKIGHVSARTPSRAVSARLTLEGRLPYDASVTTAAMYAGSAGLDPRGVAPGIVVLGASEVSAADSEAVSSPDGDTAATAASPSTRATPMGWGEATPGVSPLPTRSAALSYDSGSGRILAFVAAAGSSYWQAYSSLWAYDATGWSRLWEGGSAGDPPDHLIHAAFTHDPVRQRSVLFGGGNTIYGGEIPVYDVWTWDGRVWQEEATGPSGWRTVGVWDGNRSVFIGVHRAGSDYWNQHFGHWTFDGSSWFQHSTSGTRPPPRLSPGVAYDTTRNQLVVFGGIDPSSSSGWIYRQDTWVMNESHAWSEIGGGQTPPVSTGAAMAYHPGLDRVVLFGGCCAGGSTATSNETWILEGSAWQRLTTPASPPARSHHGMAYHHALDRLVLFGGRTPGGGGDIHLADTWELAERYWWRRPTGGTPPARSHAAAAWDPAGRAILFGGEGEGGLLGDTWLYAGGTWSAFSSPVSPAARRDAAMAFDPHRGRFVLFGGRGEDGPLQDTWELTDAGWTAVATEDAPSPRAGHAMVHDPVRGRTVLYGGQGAGGVVSNETWAYDGADWIRVPVPIAPPGRQRHAMVYHRAEGRVVLFGGERFGVDRNDTWTFDGTHWAPLSPAISPPARHGHALIDDPTGRLLLVGGRPDDRRIWSLEPGTWRDADHAGGPPQTGVVGFYDTVAGEAVVFGGTRGAGPISETWVHDAHAPHARTPAHLFTFPLAPGITLQSIAASWVGHGFGRAADDLVMQGGAQLFVWDALSGAWEHLGTHHAAAGDPAEARTLGGAIPGDGSAYLATDRVWLMAVPPGPSDAPPATGGAYIETDYVALDVHYLLP
jgi:hypothetical protein